MKRTYIFITTLVVAIVLLTSCKPPIHSPAQPFQDLRIKIINKTPDFVDLKKVHIALEMAHSGIFFMAKPFVESWMPQDKENELSLLITPIASIDILGEKHVDTSELVEWKKRTWPNSSFTGYLLFYSLETKEVFASIEMPLKFQLMSVAHPVKKIASTRGFTSVKIVDKGNYIFPLILELYFSKTIQHK